ncbi:hypothetical protein E2C01_060185 [Portunus trituberculatus]|uniref:Uncharacterized protein n=1 Tax=Portunus trituberculatus TaxID=210409 RepID=A0A5B7H4K4_PORTR|nr:hypothetical protein [Portunus trituberculatus]
MFLGHFKTVWLAFRTFKEFGMF